MSGAILRLIIGSGSKIAECVEEFTEIDPINDEERYNQKRFFISQYSDAIREIFIKVELPKLSEICIWKNNLFAHLIDSITIKGNYYEILLDSIYLKDLLNNKLENYPNESLIRNLSMKKIIKISHEKHHIILPLNIGKLFMNPNEIISINNGLEITINFKFKNLIDPPILIHNSINEDDFKVSLIKIDVFYDIEKRDFLSKNLDTLFSNQKIVNATNKKKI